MKKFPSNVFIHALTVVFVGLYAISSEAKPQPIVSATPVVILMPIVLNNPDFFDFKEEQKKQIGQIANSTNQVRESLDQSILDMRTELRDELSKYQPDPKLVSYLTQEIQSQENRRLILSVECSDNLRKVMTVEQWKTLIELTQE